LETDELINHLASYGIRRLPDSELGIEIDFAKRERDLSDDAGYKAYEVQRINALSNEAERRKRLNRSAGKSPVTLDFIRDLKARVDIRDIFNHLGILVIPSGTNRELYQCPAHPDKHPSGVVYKDQGTYNCYQCNANGDVFDIVMAMRGVRFMEAVDFVAGYLGVELPNATKGFTR
jgi:hypothetical protein